MEETAETELSNRAGWKAGIVKLLPELVTAHEDSKALCDLVGDTIDRPVTSKE